MKLYKQITTIKNIIDEDNHLTIETRDGLLFSMLKDNLTEGRYIIEEGRIICLISDQPAQGVIKSMYVRTESSDFGDDGFFKKNANYIMNPQNRLEGIPGFVLAFAR